MNVRMNRICCCRIPLRQPPMQVHRGPTRSVNSVPVAIPAPLTVARQPHGRYNFRLSPVQSVTAADHALRGISTANDSARMTVTGCNMPAATDRQTIGFCGDSPHLVTLARALAAEGSFAPALAAAAGPCGPELLQTVPHLQLTDNWHDLLAGGLDAVVICLPGPVSAEAVRQLATDIPRVVLLIDGVPDLTLLYELSLTRDDTGVLLVPWMPDLPDHHRLTELGAALRNAPAEVNPSHGDTTSSPALQHVQVEVEVEPASQAGTSRDSGFLTRQVVDWQLLRDVVLFQQFAGEATRVTAVLSGPAADSVATATVTLHTARQIPLVWQLRSGRQPGWSVCLTSSGGQQRLEAASRQAALASAASAPDEPPADETSAAGVPHRLAGRIAGDGQPAWPGLLRAVEVLDATARSARRGRSVELHSTTASERSQFKTQMIAIGCGLLTLTLLAMVLVLLVGEALHPPAGVMRLLRLLVFAPLGVFLVVQLLLLLARPARTEPGETAETDSPSGAADDSTDKTAPPSEPAVGRESSGSSPATDRTSTGR